MYKKLIAYFFAILSPTIAVGQELANDQKEFHSPYRYITRSTMYGMGCMQVLDTYLSPIEYSGVQINLLRESSRRTRILRGKVSMQTIFQGNIGLAENPSATGNELTGLLNWNYALHYNFNPINDKLHFALGPMAQIQGGFIYNTRNSNNPAQAKCYINLAASGMIAYQIPWKIIPIKLRYQLDVPLLGAMFSPQYQQSYYDIFSLGHYDGNIVFTSLHNQPSMRSWFTSDFSFRTFTLRLGYMADLHQSKVNNIKCHTYSHAFMIGFVKNLYHFKP